MKGQGLDYINNMLKTYYTWGERREEKRKDKLDLFLICLVLFLAWFYIITMGFNKLT